MAKEQSGNLQASNSKLLLIIGVVVVFVFSLFAGVLWKLDFFSFSGTDSSAKIVASAITLVGALIASLMTFVGLILKHSIDQRSLALREQTESRERIETERNSNLKEEAENRLRVEAAIQSIQLLSSPSGQDVPATQRAGVILTLGDLEMLSLALSLVDQMLSSSEQSSFPRLDPGTACWLLNKALTSDDLDVQHQASMLTDKHVEKMLLPNGDVVFPALLLQEGSASLPEKVRVNATFAMIDMLLLRPFSEWDEGAFFTLVDSLHYNWKHASPGVIRTNAGIALNTLLRVWEPDTTVHLKVGSQQVAEVLSELAQYDEQELWGNLPTSRSKRSQALLEWIRAHGRVSAKAGEGHAAASETQGEDESA